MRPEFKTMLADSISLPLFINAALFYLDKDFQLAAAFFGVGVFVGSTTAIFHHFATPTLNKNGLNHLTEPVYPALAAMHVLALSLLTLNLVT